MKLLKYFLFATFFILLIPKFLFSYIEINKISFENSFSSQDVNGLPVFYNVSTNTVIYLEFNNFVITNTITSENIYILHKADKRGRLIPSQKIIPNFIFPSTASFYLWVSTQSNNFTSCIISSITARLQQSSEYELVLTTNIINISGQTFQNEQKYKFYTTVNSIRTSNTIAPEGLPVIVEIPISAIPPNSFILSNSKTLKDFSNSITKTLTTTTSIYYLLDIRCIKSESPWTQITKTINDKKMTISYKYNLNSSNRDIVMDVNPDNITFWYFDDKREYFERINTTFNDSSNNNINAKIEYFGTYAVGKAPQTIINDISCFPIPWVPNDQFDYNGTLLDGITFVNLPYQSEIYIYSISGNLVFKDSIPIGSTEYKWFGKNRYNEDVASGVYVWIIKNNDLKKSGKLIILR